ncbi:MAG: mycofactocin biosynthesis glycosyltransferase MftF [Candidatus Competibacteraceae bacterium]|nr:mycofactocin biosynthesis glycosyltransferase MftF [Candidatus Competibacteraceae bacterium]
MTLPMPAHARIAERRYEPDGDAASAAVPWAQPARYVLQPGLEVLSDARGGVLVSRKPLSALRLNRSATALLTALQRPRTVAELAGQPGIDLAPAAIVAFLDNLLRRRLVLWQPPIPAVWPTVSIIVPARGRPDATRRCARSLLALDYPADRREIIVVDDASDPPLAPVLADLPVTLLRQDRNIGQSAARNLAASAATGTVLAFTDNDCVVEPGWLRALVPYLADPKVAIVGGRVLAAPAQGAIAAFEAVRSPLDMGASVTEVTPTADVAYLPTCNLLVKRDALLAHAGFDPSLRVGEDVDFIWRVLRGGSRAWYAPAGRVAHDHRVRWRDWLRRRADYGSSEAVLQQRHPEGRRRMPLPATSLLALLATILLPRFGWPGLWPVALAVLLFGLELAEKRGTLRRLAIALPLGSIAAALGREHGAAFYHFSADVTRYYSLPLLPIGLIWPQLLPMAVLVLAAAPLTDYRRSRPPMTRMAFVGLYWLELAAYQVGIWRGCWRWRSLRPLLPRPIWRR